MVLETLAPPCRRTYSGHNNRMSRKYFLLFYDTFPPFGTRLTAIHWPQRSLLFILLVALEEKDAAFVPFRPTNADTTDGKGLSLSFDALSVVLWFNDKCRSLSFSDSRMDVCNKNGATETGHSMNRTPSVFVCSTGRHVGPRNLQTAKIKTETQTNQCHCIRRPLTDRSAIGQWSAVYIIWPGRPHSSVAVIKGPESVDGSIQNGFVANKCSRRNNGPISVIFAPPRPAERHKSGQ
jgi:hypothetical protein